MTALQILIWLTYLLPNVHEVPTQLMSKDGPISALIKVRVFAGRTQPRYAQILARHTDLRTVSFEAHSSGLFTNKKRANEVRCDKVASRHLIKISTNGVSIDQIDSAISVYSLDYVKS